MIPLIYHPIYSQLDLPVGHRYPINKYRLLYEEIVRQREQSEAWQASFEFHTPIAAELSRITRLHDPDYVQALLEGTLSAAKMRRIGFPWSKPLIERTLYSVGGTCLTVEQALQSGVAIHLSGGYHHAHADFGSGFCLFNDLAIAAHFALSLPSVDKVLIIDSMYIMVTARQPCARNVTRSLRSLFTVIRIFRRVSLLLVWMSDMLTRRAMKSFCPLSSKWWKWRSISIDLI
ncbi:histone deacetylase/AcuC/AphA family protein [Vibrio cholerae]|nr:histone deacetylase family protein [Vibrio cholerae CP1042(15)]EMQ25866.1 histone deacetylase/AcuC/AphA family protein [Vibrio cholerae O1 str. EM-1536]EMQ26803.1 histone deacetylase/AcuC/AphA family protein [Vibrio cholerae O1 str. EDC-022]EMQ37492.1 histone deacetylase/AcuC/AphA family protein [Vibrio cholerae O1 str. EM-1626]EWM32287.1 histone deacetylase domain protein [Vibrio cholerae O1 str. PCS-022]KKP17584.1 histone deacetylase family protein [Vibrio cholerae]